MSLPFPRSHPLVSPTVTAEVGHGILVPTWEAREGPDKVLNGRSLPLMPVPFTISEERSEEKNKVAINKSWDCLRNGPFSEPFKATLSRFQKPDHFRSQPIHFLLTLGSFRNLLAYLRKKKIACNI